MKNITPLCLSILALGLLTEKSDAATFILDFTNNYTVTIDNLTISQPNYVAAGGVNGAIVFTGATAALGQSDVADFFSSTFTQIGSGIQPGGNRPQDFVTNSVDFTLRDDTSLQLFDAQITYFAAPNGNVIVGTAPVVNNTAGLVINVTPVPEPSSTFLLGIAGVSLAFRRSRKAC